MTPEHHYQRIDLETGYYIEATRDDTDEMQDLRVKTYGPDGNLIREKRIVYNIQYDYCRSQEWINSILIDDDIIPCESYGHLQWEYGAYPPEGWTNPYPDNYEPVKPEGADIFHTEGISFSVYFGWSKMSARANLYIWDDLDEFHRPDMDNLITQIEPAPAWYIQECQEYWKNKENFTKYNAAEAAKQRVMALRKHGKKIGVNIPIDSRFID